jgi:ABC-type multidrug transport system permease subunit
MSTTTTTHFQPPQAGEQGAVGRPGPWVVAATRAVLNETQKGLWLLWGHRTVVLLEILGLIAFYPFLQFVIGNGTIERALVRSTLLPFLVAVLLYLAILKLVSDLLEEVNSGTFEQMHLSPFSPASLLVGRLLAFFLEGALIAIVLGVGMSWLLGVSIPLRAAGLLPAALTLIDIAGFALLLGGLALSLPQIGAIAHLFGGLILLLNGAFVPLEWYPAWLQTLARFLPTTLGVQATRQVVLQGQSLGSVWADGTLPWLLIHAALFAVLGTLVFLLNDRRARRLGTLR